METRTKYKIKDKVKKFLPAKILVIYKKFRIAICYVRFHLCFFLRIITKLKGLGISLNWEKHYAKINNINFNINDKNLEIINKSFYTENSRNKITIENLMNNKIDLLGSGLVDLSDSNDGIKWNFDFKNNYSWDYKPFNSYNVYQPEINNDLKYPWELSRFQFLSSLARAYKLRKNEIYVNKILFFIEDWIKKNKYQYGVNWICPMDVAIRSINWLLCLILIKDSTSISGNFKKKILKQLYYHFYHVYKNLEVWRFKNNHYLSDIVALYCIGTIFDSFPDASSIKKFALTEIKNEMNEQINGDGGNFECSTTYQRLDLELFFLTLLIHNLKVNCNWKKEFFEKEFGKEYLEKLKKMFEFLHYTTKPNGKICQLGDNDSGFIFTFGQREDLDYSYLTEIYNALFFNQVKNVKNEDVFWIFGDNLDEMHNNNRQKLDEKVKYFNETGVYVHNINDIYFLISFMKLGQNDNGGHNHNDVLSFELNYKGIDIIVDPGTYCYSSNVKERDKFRSSFYHNTLIVDMEEINEFNEIFGLRKNVTEININEINNGIEISHNGYARLPDPTQVKRKVVFANKVIEISDYIFCGDTHFCNSILNLSPGIQYRKEINGIYLLGENNTEIAKIEFEEEMEVLLNESEYSIGYGLKEQSNQIVFKKKMKNGEKIGYKIILF